MKKNVLGMLLTAIVSQGAFANSTTTSGPATPIVGRSYIAKARFSQPLAGYDQCVGPNPAMLNSDLPRYEREDQGTWAGQEAFMDAVEGALNACKEDYNSDCKVVSASYRDIVSMEFIGYKACEAKVVVHGYRLQ